MRIRQRLEMVDTSWALEPTAREARELILTRVLGPLVRHYASPLVVGQENFDGLKPPVLFTANHSSHMDTPCIMLALPKPWRMRTAAVAAADYFFTSRIKASLVSLAFAAVPIERGGGMSKRTTDRLKKLVEGGWNLIWYPEGTRSRSGRMNRLRSGAAYFAIEHGIPIVPIYLHGTHDAMPPGHFWPQPHPVTVHLGNAIYPMPGEDHRFMIERVGEALHELRLSL